MQKFSGEITHIMPVTERGEYKEVQFVVKETDGKYPQSCAFIKSAKDDNKKWIDSFEKDNPIGSIVDVEYSFKAREYNGKWYTNITAFKVVNNNYSSSNKKAENVTQEEYTKVADGGGSNKEEETPGAQIDDELPFAFKRNYNKYSIGK